MAVYKWRRRPTRYFGDTWVPYAHIDIRAADGRFQAFALQIDSGAVVSLLRRSVAEVLGLKLEAGRRVELGSVGGGEIIAYTHELSIRVGDDVECRIPFAIADSESVPNLLGRCGVFDALRIEFHGPSRETRILRP